MQKTTKSNQSLIIHNSEADSSDKFKSTQFLLTTTTTTQYQARSIATVQAHDSSVATSPLLITSPLTAIAYDFQSTSA